MKTTELSNEIHICKPEVWRSPKGLVLCDHRGIWLHNLRPNLNGHAPCPVKLGIQALFDKLNLFASRIHKVHLNIISVPWKKTKKQNKQITYYLVQILLNHTWPGILQILLFCWKCQICGRVMRKWDYLNKPPLFNQ